MLKTMSGLSKSAKVLSDEAGVISTEEVVDVPKVLEKKVKKVMTQPIGQVAILRSKGYRVRVFHHRRYESSRGEVFYSGIKVPGTELCAKGGLTVVKVTLPDGSSATGFAKCCIKDAYNKKCGVRAALGRALKELNK